MLAQVVGWGVPIPQASRRRRPLPRRRRCRLARGSPDPPRWPPDGRWRRGLGGPTGSAAEPATGIRRSSNRTTGAIGDLVWARSRPGSFVRDKGASLDFMDFRSIDPALNSWSPTLERGPAAMTGARSSLPTRASPACWKTNRCPSRRAPPTVTARIACPMAAHQRLEDESLESESSYGFGRTSVRRGNCCAGCWVPGIRSRWSPRRLAPLGGGAVGEGGSVLCRRGRRVGRRVGRRGVIHRSGYKLAR